VANRTFYVDYEVDVVAPIATATPSGMIVGHVVWQGIGQPDGHTGGITGTLTLCANGTPRSYSASTDASGFFTVTTGLPGGSYDWRFKGRKWLATNGTLTLPGAPGGVTGQELGTQRAGDGNNTNLVDAQDFTIMKATFGKQEGEVGYDERGDFNNNGAVNSTDFTLLRANFGQAGAPSSCP
jgi:hypothetical protein